MKNNIKLFADCRCELSESPMWNKKDKFLYWHGFRGELYRKKINDDVNDFECFRLNIGRIGSMVFTDNDYMLLFADDVKIWKWKPCEIINEIYFPVYRIISVAFGGDDKSVMFVTTAGEHSPVGKHDGGVFMVEDMAVGAEEFILKGMCVLCH